MESKQASSDDYQDLQYQSKVTDDLIVMGTEDKDTYTAAIGAAREKGHKIICTHSDAFHCDEVLACVMLLYTDTYRNSMIVRTRD